MTTSELTYPFTEEDAKHAYEEWGCNCGPSALAFILQVPLDDVRGKIPGFEEKKYTSPTMMKAGLAAMGKTVKEYPYPRFMAAAFAIPSLVRIQWTGPWTQPGANPKWSYRYTHWIVTWKEDDQLWVFDINGGIQGFELWKSSTVPSITALYPRADGNWFPTHIWRVNANEGNPH